MKAAVMRIVSILLVLLLWSPVARAQPVADPSAGLTGAEATIRSIDRRLARPLAGEEESATLRTRIAAARQTATTGADQLEAQLALVDARIAQLGPRPGSAGEAIEIRTQRTTLAGERLQLDSTLKRARLLVVEAEQVADALQRKEAEQFGRRLSEHVPSPLTPAFWTGIVASADADFARIDRFLRDGGRQVRARGGEPAAWIAIACFLVALGLLAPARRFALALGQRYLISDAPGHRLRRSANALWRIFVGTLAPLLAAMVAVQGASWSGLLPPGWVKLLGAFIAAAGFAGFTAAVLGALLMRSQPSWRVAPIPDAVAERLRPLTWVLAGLTFFGITIDAFNAAVGASRAAVGAVKAIEGAASLLLIAGALLAISRLRPDAADEGEDAPARHPALGAAVLLLWLVVGVAAAALAVGYVEFSLFLVAMIVWATVLGSALYLLTVAVDDVATTVLVRDSMIGRALVRGVGIRGSAIDQFGVLVSGALRIVIALAGVVLLIAPFGAGSGVGASLRNVVDAAGGVEVGGVAVSPGTILRGLLVLALGLALVRGFMRWLEQRYLPATDLDNSGRNSVSLIARYVGIALAVIWALASLGIGVERIALLLSALSVGIGFGLQAITQNFVSGLILLTERPIKIGDLVKIGQDEGDVKRISVRSTEIQLPDHSTLIVPNSELITKTVLNRTLANPLGRVQLRFTVPIETDADAVRAIVSATFGEDEAVLDDPAPSIFIDGIDNGRIVFNCFAHVATQRAVYSSRSRILFVLLRRLRAADVEVGSYPQKLELLPPAPADQ